MRIGMRIDMRIGMQIDMRIGMRTDMRWACATYRWKALAGAVISSTGPSLAAQCTRVGDADVEPRDTFFLLSERESNPAHSQSVEYQGRMAAGK